MILLVLITLCTLTFFGGVCIGAVLNSTAENAWCSHLVGLDESYQPMESVCIDDFDEVSRPLIKYLAENHHPHTTVIVTNMNAQLFEGVLTTGEITGFLKD